MHNKKQKDTLKGKFFARQYLEQYSCFFQFEIRELLMQPIYRDRGPPVLLNLPLPQP